MFEEVFRFIFLLLIFILHELSQKVQSYKESDEIVGNFITSLRNDANLDLSMDEEYEDLRAELLAYHTALSSLTGSLNDPGTVPPEVAQAVAMEPGNAEASAGLNFRRSMKTTPCWQQGGICVNHKLCEGHRFLTEVPGCKDKLEVCCFTWNKFETRDLTDRGIKNSVYPWSNSYKFGGKGPIGPHDFLDSEDKQSLAKAYVSSIELVKKKQKKFKKNHKKLNSRKQIVPIVVVLKSDKK